jgi:hypothetical protein
MTMLTADTITNEQIERLRNGLLKRSGEPGAYEDMCACHAALKPTGRGYSKAKRLSARARCAEILNARNKLTAETITDEQIEALYHEAWHMFVPACEARGVRSPVFIDLDRLPSAKVAAARARCAEILNARGGLIQ